MRPVESSASTRAVRLGEGLRRSGARRTRPRTARGLRWSTARARSGGAARVTQTRPSVPSAMLSGCPGRSSTQVVVSRGLPSAPRCTRRMVRVPVSATSTASASCGEGDAVREAQAVEHRLDLAVGRAAEQPSGAGVLDEVALPLLDREDPARVGEPDRAVGQDGGVVGEEEAFAVDLAQERLEVAGGRVEGEQAAVRVADEDAPVGQVLQAERAAAGRGDRGGRAGDRVVRVDRAVGGAGPDPAVRRDEDVLGAGSGDRDDGERQGHGVTVGRGVAARPCVRTRPPPSPGRSSPAPGR